MRIVLPALLLLLAGCMGDAAIDDGLIDSASDFPLPTDPAPIVNETFLANDTLSLSDPDAIGVGGDGATLVRVFANDSLPLSAILASPGLRWILEWPEGTFGNATACGPWPDGLRLYHPGWGFNNLAGATLEPGNHTFLLYGSRFANVTFLFNTTAATGHRFHNGTYLSHAVHAVDADITTRSERLPFGASFNKTVPVGSPALFLGNFAITAQSAVGPYELEAKVESGAFVCDQDSIRSPSPGATGPMTLSAQVFAFAPVGGELSWSGHFDAQNALFPQMTANGDLVVFP